MFGLLMTYAVPVWEFISKSNMRRQQAVQNKTLRDIGELLICHEYKNAFPFLNRHAFSELWHLNYTLLLNLVETDLSKISLW